MVECLEGKIFKKGYIERVVKKKKISFWSKRLSRTIENEVESLKSTFIVCYNNTLLKNKKDKVNCYPLITYLNIYKEKASLKILQMLYLESLEKK
jgi:hypothetical protein